MIVTVVTGEASLMVFGDGGAGEDSLEDDGCMDDRECFLNGSMDVGVEWCI